MSATCLTYLHTRDTDENPLNILDEIIIHTRVISDKQAVQTFSAINPDKEGIEGGENRER